MEDESPLPGTLRTCPACGSPVAAEHPFCEMCGTEMEELPVCRKCGARFLAPVKFCEICGTPVIQEVNTQGFEDIATISQTEEYARDEPDILEPEEPLFTEPHFFPVESEVTETASTPLITKIPNGPSDNALFLPDEEMPAGTMKPPSKRNLVNIVFGAKVIVVTLLVIAAAFIIGLPFLMGGNIAFGGETQPIVKTTLPEQTTVPASMQTTMPSPVPTTRIDPLLPQPTDVIPKNQEVFFRIEKDLVTAKISVLYQNGPGANVFKSADVRVTHPDGSVETAVLIPSREIEIFLDGSKGNDRIEVIATMYTGLSYRIKDEILTFKRY